MECGSRPLPLPLLSAQTVPSAPSTRLSFPCAPSPRRNRHGVVRQAAARQRRAGDPIRILPDGRTIRIAQVTTPTTSTRRSPPAAAAFPPRGCRSAAWPCMTLHCPTHSNCCVHPCAPPSAGRHHSTPVADIAAGRCTPRRARSVCCHCFSVLQTIRCHRLPSAQVPLPLLPCAHSREQGRTAAHHCTIR